MRSFSAFLRPLAMFAMSAVLCGADPTASKLVPLVPAGASMVAGFQNHCDHCAGGHLVLTTRNTRIDLDDWLSIAGVDPTRIYDEVIEVVAPSSRGSLAEHLLLVAGRFRQDVIFHAAEINGAGTTMWTGIKILLVKTYARETEEMKDERWLAILDDRVALLGTPALVQAALQRKMSNAEPDPTFLQRLKRLPRDVTSWDVLESSIMHGGGDMLRIPPAWTRLLEGAGVVLVGVHFGSHVRVDFAALSEMNETIRIAPQDFASVFGPPGDSDDFDSVLQNRAPRVDHLSSKPDQISCSIVMSRERFDNWGTRASTRHPVQAAVAPAVASGSD